MPDQTLKMITETEAEAEALEKAAQVEARELVARARLQASTLLEEASSRADDDAAHLLRKAEAEAAVRIDAMKKQAEFDDGTIRAHAAARMDAAVDCIVGRIVNASGNC